VLGVTTQRLERVVSWFGTRHGLLCLFAIGLVVRLVAARYSDGLTFDVSLFRQWSDRLVDRGPHQFYEPGYFVDYPPGYLYVLFILGKLSRLVLGEPPSIPILKLPGIAADLCVAILALLLAERMATSEPHSRYRSRAIAAAAILLNPGLIYISAVWGQVDSLLPLIVFASIYVLSTASPSGVREACAIGLLAVAVATKPQATLVAPAIAVVLAHRHLANVTRRGWSNVATRAGLLILVGIAVLAMIFAPFGVSLTEIPSFYRAAGSVYKFTSLWAFNVWGAVGFYRPDVGSGAVTVGSIVAFQVGLAAFALATIGLAVQAWRSLARGVEVSAVAVFGVVAATCTAFTVLTRTHERYLYLAVAGLAPFVAHRPFRWALITLSACFLVNVHFVYVLYSHSSSPAGHAWTIQPLYNAIFGSAKDGWERKMLSVLTSAACLIVATAGWYWLDRYAVATGLRDKPSTHRLGRADTVGLCLGRK
jgi:dolichyl-phosphate-mannose-protein mannosyltransferase